MFSDVWIDTRNARTSHQRRPLLHIDARRARGSTNPPHPLDCSAHHPRGLRFWNWGEPGGRVGGLLLTERPTSNGLIEQIDLNRDEKADVFNFYRDRKETTPGSSFVRKWT